MTDRERLIEILENAGSMRQYPGTMARILLENGVTIPTRCKDCKHYERDTLTCDYLRCAKNPVNVAWYDEDFCSYGERRTE